MATYTEHYNAKKPNKSENYDIDIANFNNDLWDEKIFEKQDKIAGKSLSTNDFTNAYKTKLDNLENYNDTQVKSSIEDIQAEQITQNNKITSLEADNTSNKTNITQIKEKNTEQDTKLSKLENENLELKSENERLREDLKGLPTGTFSGEVIDLNDSTDMRLQRLDVLGNSRQETREGYNLLNFIKNAFKTQTINGLTIRNNEDGSFTLNGTTTDIVSVCLSERMKNLEAGIYNVSKNSSGSVSASYRNILYGNNAGKAIELCNFDSNEEQLITLTKDYEQYYFWLYIVTGITFNNYTIKPMLTKGTEKKPYEQYGTMPSPEYPSEVESCGDNVNIFEATVESFTANRQYLEYNEKENEYHILSSQTWYRKEINNLEAGEIYTLSFDVRTLTSANLLGLIRIDKDSISGTPIATASEADTIDMNYKRCKISFVANESIVVNLRNTNEIEAYIKDIKLTKGTSDTYSPFEQGNINLEICNKNLFDKNKANINYNLDGNKGTLVADNNQCVSDYIVIEENKTYSIQGYAGTLYYRIIVFYNSDKTLNKISTNTTSSKGSTFTVQANAKYVRFNFQKTQLDVIQLEEGEETEYTLHQSQTYTIPTQKPFRKIDIYKDTFIKKNGKWYERHFINRKIFDGTETYLHALDNSDENYIQVNANTNITNINTSLLGKLFKCNYFGYFANAIGPNKTMSGMRIFSSNSPNFVFSVPTSVANDIPTFKSWLSEQYNTGTPVYIDYVLAEPEEIECTAEQCEILDKIENEAKTYKGVTHIYSTDNVSPILEGTYNKDIETMINNISKGVVANV